MMTEQAIAVVIFLVLLAISVVGYLTASRVGDRLDRARRDEVRDDSPGLGGRLV